MLRGATGSPRTIPLITALVAGLGWGWLFGFVDGLPILLEGPLLLDVRVRVQALALLVCLYAITLALPCTILGLVLTLFPIRRQRRPGRLVFLASFSGLAVALALCLSSFNRFDLWSPSPGQGLPRFFSLLFSALVGGLLGQGLASGGRWWQSGRGLLRPARWAWIWRTVLLAFLLPAVSLVILFAYRLGLRHQPWLRPDGENPATPERPNIVLISIDALRADYLGAYGYPGEISPHLDALAKRGVLFEQAFSQTSWTMPSMGSVHTSLYPAELGIICAQRDCRNIRIDEERITLAEVLQRAGYTTAAFTANPLLADQRGFCQGFDICVDYHPPDPFDLSSLQQNALFRTLQQISPRSEVLLAQVYFSLFDPGTLLGPGEEINLWAEVFLRQHQGQRFFLWLHYMEPHATYDPDQPFHPLPAEVDPDWVARVRRRWHGTTKAHQKVLSAAEIEALRSLYAGEVHDVDALVGQVLDQMTALGLSDCTVVVITADHGEEFAEHGDFSHGHALYREVVLVPLIIAGPPVQVPGRRVDTAVPLLDIFPTLTEIAGGTVPPEAHGRSLVPILQGEEPEPRPIFSESINSRRPHEYKAMRWQQYVLIHNVFLGGIELYDLSIDPSEQVDLSQAAPEIAQDLLSELQAWAEDTDHLAAQLARGDSATEIDERTQDALRDLGY